MTEITTHTHPDGTTIATARLPGGRVLRCAGVHKREYEAWLDEPQHVLGPREELDKTLRWMGMQP